MCVQIGDVVSKTQQSAIKKRYQWKQSRQHDAHKESEFEDQSLTCV